MAGRIEPGVRGVLGVGRWGVVQIGQIEAVNVMSRRLEVTFCWGEASAVVGRAEGRGVPTTGSVILLLTVESVYEGDETDDKRPAHRGGNISG